MFLSRLAPNHGNSGSCCQHSVNIGCFVDVLLFLGEARSVCYVMAKCTDVGEVPEYQSFLPVV